MLIVQKWDRKHTHPDAKYRLQKSNDTYNHIFSKRLQYHLRKGVRWFAYYHGSMLTLFQICEFLFTTVIGVTLDFCNDIYL